MLRLGISSSARMYVASAAPDIVRVNSARTNIPFGGAQETLSLAVTAGNVVVVCLSGWYATITGVTDDLGNTYNLVAGTVQSENGVHHGWFWSVIEFSGTATIASSTQLDYGSIQAVQYSGLNANMTVSGVLNASGSMPSISSVSAKSVMLCVGHTEPNPYDITYTLTPDTGSIVLTNNPAWLQRPIAEYLFTTQQTNIQIGMTPSNGNTFWNFSVISLSQ